MEEENSSHQNDELLKPWGFLSTQTFNISLQPELLFVNSPTRPQCPLLSSFPSFLHVFLQSPFYPQISIQSWPWLCFLRLTYLFSCWSLLPGWKCHWDLVSTQKGTNCSLKHVVGGSASGMFKKIPAKREQCPRQTRRRKVLGCFLPHTPVLQSSKRHFFPSHS